MKKVFLWSLVPVIFWACGGGEKVVPMQKKNLPEPNQSPELVLFNSTLKPVLMAKCERCHNGASFLNDPEAYRSMAQPTVANRSMPPSGQLPESEYSLLVNF